MQIISLEDGEKKISEAVFFWFYYASTWNNLSLCISKMEDLGVVCDEVAAKELTAHKYTKKC